MFIKAQRKSYAKLYGVGADIDVVALGEDGMAMITLILETFRSPFPQWGLPFSQLPRSLVPLRGSV
jgi:hypothetical protein